MKQAFRLELCNWVSLLAMKACLSRLVVISGLMVLLASCAQNPPAPVVDMTRTIPSAAEVAAAGHENPPAQHKAPPGHYQVEKGDTLYSIAFHNQLDWQELAQWNGIGAPYTIVPGEDLRLTRPPASQAGRTVTTYGTGQQSASASPVSSKPIASTPPAGAASAPASTPSKTAAATPPPVQVAASPTSNPGKTPPSSPSRTVAGLTWHWPADGPLLSTYVASDPTRQGIDIGGRRGLPVRAAADGVVVYSGNGLVGYGELVIVKHSDTYLSAYGHNRERLVKEGERVKAGQQIATMGSSGTSRTELHFEIRKHGQPIDPLGFLPRK
ncbi:MAG: peptidoglycan DD-metalloendopeptidase family protein [Rhodanobacteraceae bacterium]